MRQHREPLPGDPNDPDGITAMVLGYFTWMREHYYSERTIEGRHDQLRPFLLWLTERGMTRANEVTRPILERYQRHLFYYRKKPTAAQVMAGKEGEPLSLFTQQGRISAIRELFHWLTKRHYLLYNPASELELPRVGRRLPKYVLTTAEAEQVLNQPNLEFPTGLRDRAIMETLYSTGIRRQELIDLKLDCIDRDRGTLTIRQGKGRKDRVIPIGARAVEWIDKYLTEARPSFAKAREGKQPDEGILFLWKQGRKLNRHSLGNRMRRYVQQAAIGKPGGCHLFRHTMATLMHEGGADVRYIQQMLGHADLNTTQIYTQVSIRKLKEVHTQTHPAANPRPRDTTDTAKQNTNPDDDENGNA